MQDALPVLTLDAPSEFGNMNKYAHILAAHDIRLTSLRLELLRLLYSTEKPLSHGEIMELLGNEWDRITLYRNLALLEEHRVIHKIQGTDGSWRFRAHPLNTPGCPGNHAHFCCLECGTMLCLLDQPMPRVNVPEGCSVEGKQFLVYGICRVCGEAKKARKKTTPPEESEA